MPYFYMEATILAWVDADTLDVDPAAYPWGVKVRVRLRDRWLVEANHPEHAAYLAASKELIGDVGATVVLRNTRHRFTYGRLEARVDKLALAPPPETIPSG